MPPTEWGVHPSLLDALGGSLLYEESKGDFLRARTVAERLLGEARASGDRARLADALRWRGTVSLLQGRTAAAASDLEGAAEAGGDDPGRRLLVLAWTAFNRRLRYLLVPDLSGYAPLEFEREWEPVQATQREEQERERLIRLLPEPPGQDFELIWKALLNLPLARQLVSSRDISTPAEHARRLGVAVTKLSELLGVLALGSRRRAFVERCLADLFRIGGERKRATRQLESARCTYEDADDAVGVAACRLLEGDWRLAPRSSPLVWNRSITQSLLGGLEDHEGLASEGTGPDIEAAESSYAACESLLVPADRAGRGRIAAALLLRRGYLAHLSGENDRGLESIESAVRVATECGDELLAWTARTHRIAVRLARGGDVDLEACRAIGVWGRDQGSRVFAWGLGAFLARVGQLWWRARGHYESGLGCLKAAAALFEELSATHSRASAGHDQVEIRKVLRDRAGALAILDELLEEHEERFKAKPNRANWQLLTWATQQAVGTYTEPEQFERLAERISGFLSEAPEDTSDAGFLAPQFAGFDELTLKRSLHTFSVAVPLLRGRRALAEGREEEAHRYFEQALDRGRETSSDLDLFLQALVHQAAGRYGEAAEAFKRHLARGGAASGEMDRFLKAHEQQFGLGGRTTANELRAMDHLHAARFFVRVQAWDEARAHLEQLEAELGREWWRRASRSWESLAIYGEVRLGLGELQGAFAVYEEAVAAVERRRGLILRNELRAALVDSPQTERVFFQGADAALNLRDLAADPVERRALAGKAFELAERGRARSLLDLVSSGPAVSALQRSLGAEIGSLKSRLVAEARRPHPERGRIESLRDRLRLSEIGALPRTSTEGAAEPGASVEVMACDEVGTALPKGAALLEYYFLDESFLGWAIRSDGLVRAHRVTEDASRITREVRRFHRACANPSESATEAVDLSRLFLAPFDDVIEEHEHLIVVPFGEAHLLPFSALPWRGRPLVENRAVSYLPSASLLRCLGNGRGSPIAGSGLIVGAPRAMSYRDPVTGAERAAPNLSAAELEARFLATQVPDRRLLLGADATRSAVSAALPGSRWFHLATHGVLSEEAPLLSALLLANGEQLTVADLLGMDLHAELAVLSACRTGLGTRSRGDDLAGFARGLLASGVGSIVVSLWPVDDVSTCILMAQLYRRLQAGVRPAAALAGAQRYLKGLAEAEFRDEQGRLQGEVGMRAGIESADGGVREVRTGFGPTGGPQPSHPFHWAPFLVIGRG